MKKKVLIAVLKLLIVAALFGVIFYAIDWQDSYSRISPEGETVERIGGQIVGPWDQDTVRFRADGASTVNTLQRTTSSAGESLLISPGFLTYLKNLDLALFALGAALFFIFVVIINSRWWYLLRANGLGVRFLEAQRFGER